MTSTAAGSTDLPTAGPTPRRSDATRAAILKAAITRFAADGYDRATIRAIARDAGIDPSMVMRYYGSKEGLFQAASDVDLRLPDFSGTPPEQAGERIVRHFLQRWEEDDVLAAVLRVAATGGLRQEQREALFGRQLVPLVARYCPDPAQVPVRAALIVSQIVGMAMLRYLVRLPAVTELGHEELVGWLAPTVQRYLTGEVADGVLP